MDIRMEHTDGLGREAEVWLDGALLTVCDGISEAGSRTPPGPVDNVELRYVTDQAFSWQLAVEGNPSRRVTLEPVKGWSYVGYGRVEQILPVVVHFGVVRIEDSANWATDESLVGRYVRVMIDRLDLVPASSRDYPEEAR